jgi:ribosomal protein L40E/membrane protein implicated in regulation of membrane protease activity
MAKRSDSILGPIILLIVGGGFALFWITLASSHGAPALFPLFGVVFLAVLLITLGGSILKTLDERSRNQAAPMLTSQTRVVAKRMEVKNRGKSHTTEYYATFDLPSGERLELELDGAQYGQVAEGDGVLLRHQGTWFLGFERQPAAEPERPGPPGEELVCEYCAAVNPPGTRKCSSCGSSRLVPRTAESAT